MKKLILSLLIGGLMMTGLSANPATPLTGSGNTGSVAFVYFSATGTTERMAKNAAKEMGADVYEIQPVHKYTNADLNWHNKNSLSSIECNDPKSRPAIKSVVSTLRQGSGTADSTSAFDISGYDTVVVCYPIWWAYAPKILYTFTESQNWSGKKMITLCTSGGSGLGRSGSDIAKFAKGVDFKGGKDFTRGSGADVKNYIEGLLK